MATTLPEIDDRIATAGSLDGLLSAPLLVEQYFSDLAAYYGSKPFHRVCFDRILTQLRELVAALPEVKARLWETETLGDSFSIRAEATSYGRKVDVERWRPYSFAWVEGLKKKAGPLGGLRGREWYPARVRLEGAQRELEFFLQFAESLSVRKRRIELARFVRKLVEREEVDLVAAKALHTYAAAPEFGDVLASENAELILDEFRSLRQNPGGKLGGIYEAASVAHAAIRAKIPSITELLASGMFPSEYAETGGKRIAIGGARSLDYNFVPIPRRIHGIWKGIPHADCLSGNPESLDSISHARWASIALPLSSLHHVMEGSHYRGYVHVTPIRKASEVFGSLEFQAPALIRNILMGGADGEKKSERLFRIWLRTAARHLPRRYAAFVAPENSHTNRYFSVFCREMLDTGDAAVVGDVRDFTADWELADEVVRLSPWKDFSAPFERRMLVEGLISHQGGKGRVLLLPGAG